MDLQEDPQSSHRTIFGVDFVPVSAEKSLLFISLELQPFLCNWICFYSNVRCRVLGLLENPGAVSSIF